MRYRPDEQPLQSSLSLDERQFAQVNAVKIEKVEDVVGEPILSTTREIRLQFGKVRPIVLGDDEFAVEYRAPYRNVELSGDRAQTLRPVVAVARVDCDAAVFDVRLDAIAIELDFMKPIAARRPGSDRRELGRNEAGHIAGGRALPRYGASRAGSLSVGHVLRIWDLELKKPSLVSPLRAPPRFSGLPMFSFCSVMAAASRRPIRASRTRTDMNDEPLAWRMARLRGEILELRSAVHHLDRAGRGNATAQLLLNRKCAELEGLIEKCPSIGSGRKVDHIK